MGTDNIQAIRAAYARGYQTGLNWTEDYRPGGPWVPYSSPHDRYQVMRQQLLAERDAWLEGFDTGLAYKNNLVKEES